MICPILQMSSWGTQRLSNSCRVPQIWSKRARIRIPRQLAPESALNQPAMLFFSRICHPLNKDQCPWCLTSKYYLVQFRGEWHGLLSIDRGGTGIENDWYTKDKNTVFFIILYSGYLLPPKNSPVGFYLNPRDSLMTKISVINGELAVRHSLGWPAGWRSWPFDKQVWSWLENSLFLSVAHSLLDTPVGETNVSMRTNRISNGNE